MRLRFIPGACCLALWSWYGAQSCVNPASAQSAAPSDAYSLGVATNIDAAFRLGEACAASYSAAEPEPADKASIGAADATPSHTTAEDASCENCQCGSMACCDPILPCNMCPCTYAWAEGLMMWRDNQAARQPLVLDLNTGDPLLATRDLDFGTAGGVRAGFGIRTCPPWAWEFGYLGLFDQTAEGFVALADGLAVPGNLGLAGNNFFFADEVSVRYVSDVHSAEINGVLCCHDPCHSRSIEWLYGFRYLNLHETFSLVSTDFQESTTLYRIRTNNNLFGGQIGTRIRRAFGQWSWEATGKAGLFGNDASQSADPIIDFPNFELRPARRTDEGEVSFVGDLNLSGIYHLNHVWGLRAGYNLIWIEGVALAPDQLDFTNTPDSGTQLFTGGGVLLHGINVGLEARW